MEDLAVAVSQLKYGVIVGSQVRLGVLVDAGPLIKAELHIVYLTLKQVLDMNSLINDFFQVLLKKEGRRVNVLILDNVLNYKLDSTDLVVFDCTINSRPIEIPVIRFLYFVFIKQWVLAGEMLVEFLLEHVLHGFAFERHD